MRIGAASAYLMTGLAWFTGPAHAEEFRPGATWTAAFASVETETLTTFASAGSKRGVYLPHDPQSIFIAGSYGVSLSEAHRAYRGKVAADQVDGQARLMIGFERVFPQVFMSFAVGPAMARMKKLNTAGSEVHAGIVGQMDLWWRPRDDLYLTLTTTGDTAEQSFWNRARIGWKPLDLPFAIGPEAAAGVGRNWSKLKAGMHIGDVKFWIIGLDASAGFMIDEKNRRGRYASLAMYLKY